MESDWEAAAPWQLGGPGEDLALPRFISSPSPAAAGEGVGGVRAVPADQNARRGCRFPLDTAPCQPSPWERGLGGEGVDS